MIPVDDGNTSPASHPNTPAASSHIRRASRMPWRPVQALALPALTTTPRSLPPATCSRPTTTGAATTLLVVNTAAAVAVRSQTSRPTSGERLDLIPAYTPPARKPRGESRCRSPSLFLAGMGVVGLLVRVEAHVSMNAPVAGQ